MGIRIGFGLIALSINSLHDRIDSLVCRVLHTATLLTLTLSISVGCDTHPATAPVQGSVLFEDQPLKFGSVMFQPTSGGQPARGEIQPDGTFILSTFSEGDGAIIGSHRVRIMCNSVQDPNNTAAYDVNAANVGRLMIPRKYTQLSSSGLTADVSASENGPFEFRLTKSGR